MEREIKFRAKCLDNGEWVCGGSSLISDDFCVIQKGTEFYCETRVYSRTERFFQLQGFVCDKKTLGQFTGLLDKNGKEIYEGDVIQFQFTQFSSCSSKLFLSEQLIGIITIDKWNNHIIKSNGLEIHISNACEYGVVIGNIHDTPELLKTETL